jgi:hypothetical protein
MTFASIILILIWLTTVVILAGRWMEDLRVLHNNLVPGASSLNYMKSGLIHRLWFRFDNMDPARLNETGRERLKRAIRNERLMYLCMVAGLPLCAYVF